MVDAGLSGWSTGQASIYHGSKIDRSVSLHVNFLSLLFHLIVATRCDGMQGYHPDDLVFCLAMPILYCNVPRRLVSSKLSQSRTPMPCCRQRPLAYASHVAPRPLLVLGVPFVDMIVRLQFELQHTLSRL